MSAPARLTQDDIDRVLTGATRAKLDVKVFAVDFANQRIDVILSNPTDPESPTDPGKEEWKDDDV